MIVVVTGSREYMKRHVLFRELEDLHARYNLSAVIHGAASGADGLAGLWARTHGIMEVAMPYASALGKRGGPVRNGWLLTVAQALAQYLNPPGLPEDILVVAFPLPDSVGTWDCVNQAKDRGLNIRIVKHDA